MNIINLMPAFPEMLLLIAGLGILVVDMFLPDEKRMVTWLLSLAAIVLFAGMSFYLQSGDGRIYLFGSMFVSDAASHLLKLSTCLVMFFTLVYARRYVDARGMTSGFIGGEFYVLALFSMLGQMITISAASFLTLYLGIELMSLPLYALIAMRRDKVRTSEAAIKYFILGALGSGFLLYGISMLYGATGTLGLQEMARMCAAGSVSRIPLIFGTVFVVAGIAFKLGVAPFHMWVPDVYDGAPTAVTLLIGGAPKLAAFAICLRVLLEGLIPLAVDWQQMLLILAILSMAVGNITALMQTSIKRMLAYSAIAQMGFMLMGLLSGMAEWGYTNVAANAYSAALFYTVVYVLAVLGAFGVIMALSSPGFEMETLEDFRGLGKRHPWLAFTMMIFMLSLAGLPPLAGFYAKLSVLEAVVASGRIWLAILAVLLSVVGAFYYLRVIRLMYFNEPPSTETAAAPEGLTVTVGINMAAVVLLGILPGFLMTWCQSAIVRALVL